MPRRLVACLTALANLHVMVSGIGGPFRAYVREDSFTMSRGRRLGTDFKWGLTLNEGFPQFPQNLTNVTDYVDDMTVTYNYTGTLSDGKTLQARILQYDCLGATDNVGVNISAVSFKPDGQLQVDTNIDALTIADSVAHYHQISAGEAAIDFCLRVDYVYVGPDSIAESMNFHETKVKISVDLFAGFEITAVDVQTEDPSSTELKKEVDAPIVAYFCNENFEDIGQPEFAQGDLVVGCMAVVPEKQHEFSVDYVIELDFDSGDVHDDVIVNGVLDNFVDVKCCGGICQFTRILTSKYFVVPNPPPLRIAGGVILKYTPTVNMIPQMRQFYDETDGPNWSIQGGWTIGCPCEWRGVSCNPAQYITGIDLPSTGLKGPIPSIIANVWTITSLSFSGNSLTSIPAALGNLPLTKLDLTNNNIQSIPTQVGLLTDLTEFKLANNQISTPLPTELANIPGLTVVELANNQIPGPLPAYLGALTNLVHLEVRDNAFSGEVPASYGQLSLLKSLTLTRNQIASIPVGFFNNLVNLESLDVSYNQLVSIGDEIGSLSENLKFINLSHNDLTSLPTTLGNLAVLETLDVTHNSLSGNLLTEIGSLGNLRRLLLGYNALTGTVPSEWANCESLQEVSLRQNQLQDIFPSHLKELSGLNRLDLGVNKLSGNLPAVMSGFAGLTYVDISSNKFDGPVNDWTPLASLRELRASYNALTGTIPAHFADCNNLHLLHLADNQLTGLVTTELASIPFLRDLNLANNQLTGSIPVELSDTASLFYLDLSRNDLTGELPTQFGLMNNLNSLRLAGNQFVGQFKTEMGNMIALSILDLSENLLSGPLPAEIGGLTRMSTLLLNNNVWTGTLPTDLASMTLLDILDVSDNEFVGTVPSAFGVWNSLQTLRFDKNNLTGSMPADVCALRERQCFESGYCEQSWDIVNELTADCVAKVSCDCCTACS